MKLITAGVRPRRQEEVRMAVAGVGLDGLAATGMEQAARRRGDDGNQVMLTAGGDT